MPPPKANDTTDGQAEAKKSKRERKEERQKNRKKEKKELRLENHQENSKSHKPKKRKTGQEAERAARGEDAQARAAGKRSRGKDGDGARGTGSAGEAAPPGPGKRKRKLSEGAWLAHALGFVKITAANSGYVESVSLCFSHQVKAEGVPVSSPDLEEKPRGAGLGNERDDGFKGPGHGRLSKQQLRS